MWEIPFPIYLLVVKIAVVVLFAVLYLFGCHCCCRRKKKPPQPGPISAILKEERMAGTLVYDVNLPAGGQDDVVSREFSVQVNDGTPDLFQLTNDVLVQRIRVPQDSSVLLSLVNIDDAGNRSTPSTQTFAAKDTIPPDAPGPFGEITLVAEE